MAATNNFSEVCFMDEGVNFTAGLPLVRTSPDHGTAYDIAGKGIASEASFRQAVYTAIDVFRNRLHDKEYRVNPLRKQYYEKRDDSDKLKLDAVDDEEILWCGYKEEAGFIWWNQPFLIKAVIIGGEEGYIFYEEDEPMIDKEDIYKNGGRIHYDDVSFLRYKFMRFF